MKPKASLRFLLGCPIIALIAMPGLHAQNHYWDSNGSTAGFGNTTGTWGTNAFWTTVAGGGATHTGVTTLTTAHTANFGTATLNYDNAAVGVAAGGVTATSIVFGAGQTTALTIGSADSGTITLGGDTRTIIANSSGHSILAPIELTGATIVRLTYAPPSAAVTSLTLGALSGTGGVTFENTAGGNPNPATFVLKGASTYSGNTILQSTVTNAGVELRLDVDDALPTTTVLNLQGAAGPAGGSNRNTSLNLNGSDQTLAGLSNSGGGSLRTFRVFSSSASTLTINDSGNRTFSGLIGNGGTNIAIVKQGEGTWTLSGANTYVGTTTISGGAINIRHATALGSAAGGTSVSAGVALQIQNGITVASETLTLNGTGVSNTGALRNISGTNNYNGAITLGSASLINSDAGTLNLGGGITGTGLGLTVGGAGATTISTNGINTGAGGSLTKIGNGALTIGVASDFTGLATINGGAVVVQNANALGTTAAGTVVNGTNTSNPANARLELSGGVTITGESATISGSGNFYGALSSTSGNNVWAGDVTIGASGTRIGALAGASLEISGTIDSGASPHGVIIRTTDLTGSVILSGANTYLGNTQVLIGKLQLAGGDDRLPVGTNLILSGAESNPAEFDLNGRNQEVAGLSIGGSANATQNSVNNSSGTLSTLTVNTAVSASTYAGRLDGNLALTKTGADTLTLTGTSNTYTGATNVNQGTLIVNGNISTSILTTVSDDATLGGGGTLGNLTFEGGSFFDIFDAVNNSDSLGSATITFSTTGFGIANLVYQGLAVDWSSIADGTYTLITGTLDNTNLDHFGLVNAYDLGGGRSAYFQSGSLQLVIIPEPHAALLGGIGVLLLFRRRRA